MTELIGINLSYDPGVFGREVFTMLVLMALFGTTITSRALRRWLPAPPALLRPITPAGSSSSRPGGS